MALVLKSNRVATASLGNVNGIKGSQNWAVFLDFENEIYQTKKDGVIAQNYLLQDVVEASRANLNGSPISISKNGIERNITSTSEIRTALLRNGRFGLLSEDLNENFFKNSANPVTQSIALPASRAPVVVSCEGGELTVTGDIVESGAVVISSMPRVFTRKDTTKAINLTVTVSGNPDHVQVELATGTMTASSKVTTTAVNATRVRETVTLKPDFLKNHIANKGDFTIVVQTIDYNPVVNPQKSGSSNRLGFKSGGTDIVCTTGISNITGQYFQQPRVYQDNSSFDASRAAFLSEPKNDFHAFTSAVSINSSKLKMVTDGYSSFSQANLPSPFFAETLNFGLGYSSPIAINGLRGIVTKLVIYDRVLSDSELIEISKSWK